MNIKQPKVSLDIKEEGAYRTGPDTERRPFKLTLPQGVWTRRVASKDIIVWIIYFKLYLCKKENNLDIKKLCVGLFYWTTIILVQFFRRHVFRISSLNVSKFHCVQDYCYSVLNYIL